MAQMLCPGRNEDQYVVEENKDKPSQEGAEDVIHQSLKGGRRVREAE
jgi:hypothetical protein